MPEINSKIVQDALKLPPAEAIAFLEAKGITITWSFVEQLKINNGRMFTVAGVTKLDVLQDIKDELEKSLKDGLTFKSFQKNLTPKLQNKGWIGKDGLPPYRLKNIYNTNVSSAMNNGRWVRQTDNKGDRPFLQYSAILDASTRPRHRALNGIVRHIDSPFWKTYYPPNGYGCRCSAKALTSKQAALKGKIAKRRPTVTPDEGFSNPPDTDWEPNKNRWDKDIEKLGGF